MEERYIEEDEKYWQTRVVMKELISFEEYLKKSIEFYMNELREKLQKFCQTDAGARYNTCPFFDDVEDDVFLELERATTSYYLKQDLEKNGLKNKISRGIPTIHELDVKREYKYYIENYVSFYNDLYSKKINSASEQMDMELKYGRNKKKGSDVGYITNAYGALLAYEFIKGVFDSKRKMDEKDAIWRDYLTVQNQVFNELKQLWIENLAEFMKGINELNKKFVKNIMNRLYNDLENGHYREYWLNEYGLAEYEQVKEREEWKSLIKEEEEKAEYRYKCVERLEQLKKR